MVPVWIAENIVLFYVTLGLFCIFVVLLVLFTLRHFKYKRAISGVQKHLEKKGIKIVDGQPASEDEVDSIMLRLKTLIESEREVQRKERQLTKKIEDLYEKSRPFSDEAKSTSLKSKKKSKKKEVEETEDRQESKSSARVAPDTKKVLLKIDELLEKLPEEVIDAFVQSPEFETYQKVLEEAKK